MSNIHTQHKQMQTAVHTLKQNTDAPVKAMVGLGLMAVLCKPDYILCAIRPAPGLDYSRQHLAVLPARLHPNMWPSDEGRYPIGTELTLKLHRSLKTSWTSQTVWIANAEQDFDQLTSFTIKTEKGEKRALVLDRSKKQKKDVGPKLNVGDLCQASITSKFHPQFPHAMIVLRLNNGAKGYLHVTEFPCQVLAKCLATANQQSAIETFINEVGDKDIQVKVISAQREKVDTELSKTRVRFGAHVYHCTMNDKKMEQQNKKPTRLGYRMQFDRGTTVNGVVQEVNKWAVKVSVNGQWTGSISLLRTSTQLTVVRQLHRHFHCGQYLSDVLVIGKDKRHNNLTLSLVSEANVKVTEHSPCLARICKRSYNNGDLDTCLSVELPNGQRGVIGCTDVTDNYDTIDNTLTTLIDNQNVIRVVPVQKIGTSTWRVSLRPSQFADQSDNNQLCPIVNDPQITSINQLCIGQQLRVWVCRQTEQKRIAWLAAGIWANIEDKGDVKRVNDLRTGQLVEVRITNIDVETSAILVELVAASEMISKYLCCDTIASDVPTFESVVSRKRQFSENDYVNNDDVKVIKSEPTTQNIKEQRVEGKMEIPEKRLELCDPGFDWEPDAFAPKKFVEIALAAEQSSTPQTVNVKAEPSTSKKQESKEHKSLHPDTITEFDQLLMECPNSAELWIKYANMFTEAGDIERARQTLKRALDTVNYREESDRLNIWMCSFKLELQHGDDEQRETVLKQALANCDQLSVYKQVVLLLQQTQKIQECDSVLDDMLRKYRSTTVDVWLLCAKHYLTTKRTQKCHDCMQRALKTMPKQQHVTILLRFAQLEMRFGDRERAVTLFESLLAAYPKRTDIWLVYIDMIVKYHTPLQARPIFTRVTSLPLGAHKMRIFFKKWVEFENKHGTNETQTEVNEKAAQYVHQLQKDLAIE